MRMLSMRKQSNNCIIQAFAGLSRWVESCIITAIELAIQHHIFSKRGICDEIDEH